ncbi:hypothetical protein IGI37_001790 [Enterococcus sp. AZ194]|uniref:DUF1611 domain-containing protein n=1 Tax=Enterococcus sp. AZ194 TaxID=2774629 RepID=UPI003F26A46C
MKTVVIVDSGLKREIIKEKNVQGFGIHDKKIITDFSDSFGHGTAIYDIISREIDCEKIQIIMVKLFEETTVEEEDLVFALEYIESNFNADIINLSLGITQTITSSLQKICKRLTNKGVFIVSAFDNDGAMSFPAAYNDVIGVSTSSECIYKGDYVYLENSPINILAKGNIQRVSWIKPKKIFLGGNSLACAHATSQILKIILGHTNKISKENLDDCLKKGAKKICHFLKKERAPILPPIKKAILFPFNKEMHSLVRFHDLLNFSIVGVFDIKYSVNMNKSIINILDDDFCLNQRIQDISTINWEEFDTLIIGHTDALDKVKNFSKNVEMLIEKAEQTKKNIIFFDDRYKEYIGTNRNVYIPEVLDKNICKGKNLGKLFQISKPILGFFGTSSRQGKFTLQLRIRRKLIEMGYQVGQLGTEPSSLLYQMNEVFPIGYNSTIKTIGEENIGYINELIQEVSTKKIDIILIGGQSGVVPYDFGNANQFNLLNQDLLLGTQPDAVLLSINVFDDLSYIRRTISYLEGLVDCKVIGLVIYPFEYPNNWQGSYGKLIRISNADKKEIIEKYQQKFSLPVFFNEDDEIEKIMTEIVNYFS